MSKIAEDGWGGEGGTVDNIGGEVGSIPPYPTFIPPGPKKLFRRHPCCPEVLSIVLSKFPFRRCAEVSFWNFANIKLGKLREVLTNRINLSPTNTLNFSSLTVKLRPTYKSKWNFWLVWNTRLKLRAEGGGGAQCKVYSTFEEKEENNLEITECPSVFSLLHS